MNGQTRFAVRRRQRRQRVCSVEGAESGTVETRHPRALLELDALDPAVLEDDEPHPGASPRPHCGFVPPRLDQSEHPLNVVREVKIGRDAGGGTADTALSHGKPRSTAAGRFFSGRGRRSRSRRRLRRSHRIFARPGFFGPGLRRRGRHNHRLRDRRRRRLGWLRNRTRSSLWFTRRRPLARSLRPYQFDRNNRELDGARSRSFPHQVGGRGRAGMQEDGGNDPREKPRLGALAVQQQSRDRIHSSYPPSGWVTIPTCSTPT